MKINRDPSSRQQVVFSAVLPVAFALLGFNVGHRHGIAGVRGALWGIGAVITAAYYTSPGLRRPLYVGMSRAAYPIGWLVSHVILLVVFLLVVTPVALLLRLSGRDPMLRRFDPSAQSYWVPRRPSDDIHRYFQQF